MKNKLAARKHTGKTTPAATAPMANAYANAAELEKTKNLVANFRQWKSTKLRSQFLCINIKGNNNNYQTP